MLSVLAFIITGVVIGYFIRKYPVTRFVPRIISIIIMLLLFFLGISVGGNPQVVQRFQYIGWDAFVIATAATLGSMASAWWVYRTFFTTKNRGK